MYLDNQDREQEKHSVIAQSGREIRHKIIGDAAESVAHKLCFFNGSLVPPSQSISIFSKLLPFSPQWVSYPIGTPSRHLEFLTEGKKGQNPDTLFLIITSAGMDLVAAGNSGPFLEIEQGRADILFSSLALHRKDGMAFL